MAADQFFIETLNDIGKAKPPPLGGDLRVKNDLKKKVTEFFPQSLGIPAVDGLQGFVGFFEQVWPQGTVRLPAIPRASLGGAQFFHDPQESIEAGARRLFFFFPLFHGYAW